MIFRWLTAAPNPTDPEITTLSIYDVDSNGDPDTLLGSTTVVADSPGGPAPSQDVNGSGYVWFPVWADGSAGDTLNVAQVKAVATPEPGVTVLLTVGLSMTGLLAVRRSWCC